MNVIITSPSLDPNLNVNGISSVTSFIINNNSHYNYYHIELGKRDKEQRGIKWFLRIISSFIKYFSAIAINKVQIVHFNFALNKASILRDIPFIFLARLFNCKLIIHIHGGEFLESSAPSLFIKQCLYYLFTGEEKKIVLSESEKKLVISKYKAENVFVLANCIELDEAKSFSKITNHLQPLKVLFLGRITVSKGIAAILDAFKILNSYNCQILFSCAGEGPERLWFTNEIQSVLGNCFSYKGILKNEDKINALKESDVFLLPSLYGEGLPMALLEAMSFGLLPIVTNDGSIGSIIKDLHTGFIIDKSSPEQIANKLLELDRNRYLLAKLGKNAKNFIFTHFDSKTYINKLNYLYELD